MKTNQGKTVYLKKYQAPQYRTLTVDLDFILEPENTRVISNLVLERQKGVEPQTPLHLDGEDLELISIKLDGKLLEENDFRITNHGLTVKTLPKASTFELEIETQINPAKNTQLSGLYRSGGNYCTQCEAEGFRRITYFQDRPDILAVYTTRIEADKSINPVLLGNGNPIKKGSAGKGRHYTVWHDPHPKPSYLFALVGGDLGSIHKPFTTQSGKKVKLGIYVEKGKEDSAHYAMDALIRSMQWDEQRFGCEYDLDVFNIVAVSDFNMGAMENKGLNIFNDKYVLAKPETATDADYANIERIIAHEYFHNWTGNRITCRDWFQLCLKEGLTVYRDQEFSSDERSRPVIRIGDVRGLKAAQFPEDAGPLAHPVRPDRYSEINNFYTATIYQKGAEIVRMIATILGEAKFKKGMDLYLKRHDGKAATIEEFLKCFEQAGKIDLSQFALWYSQAGTPLLNVSSKYERSTKRMTVEIEQITPSTPGQARKKPMVIPQHIGLVSKLTGDVTPTSMSGAELSAGAVLINKRKTKLVFEGVEERPILSLNRGFTAPIEVNYRQSNSDLAFLARNDSDAFGQWQAFQTFATRLIISATKAIQAGKKPVIDQDFLDVAKEILLRDDLEPAYRATFLNLPSENDIAQEIGKNVNPEAIAKAISAISIAMGKHFEDVRKTVVKSIDITEAFAPSAEQAGKRALKSTLMRFGVVAKMPAALKEIGTAYRKADNMSDLASALQIIVHHNPEKALCEKVLNDFYKRYKDDHITLDKWFSVQASKPGANSAATVKRLMKHSDFSLSNPNRMRSVIGVFCMANPTGFNASSGKGYKLVADTIIKLDALNPQVASRTLTGFRSWKNLDASRRKLAEKALRKIEAEVSLSRDVRDIITRTLSG